MQTTITTDDVVGIKPDFKQFTDKYINRVIRRAVVRATGDGLDNPAGVKNDSDKQDIFDGAILDYSRHLLSMDIFNKHNGVTSAATMNNSQTITDKTNGDVYLSEYNRTVNLYGTSLQEKGGAIFYAD